MKAKEKKSEKKSGAPHPDLRFHPLTDKEVGAYKRFSKECHKVEKSLYGKTALQDSKLKELLGKDTSIDWATTFEWLLSIKNMFDRQGVEAFLDKIAPDLVTKLLAIEEKSKTFLTLARALLNGLGYGTRPIISTAPPVDPMMPTGASAPGALPVVPASKTPPPETPVVPAAPPEEVQHHGRK